MTRYADPESNEPVAITVTVKHATEKALLCEHEGDAQWVPLSQIHDDSEVYHAGQVGETGQLVIPRWLAKAKGWD